MSYNQQRPGVLGGCGMNSPFGDTTLTKVFVGGLAWETQSDSLGRYFEQFGEILEAVVIADKNTGRSKGYGFVTFQDPESARRACADPNPIIDGRRANCNLASLGRPQPVVPFGRLGSPASYSGGFSVARGAYVGNFGYQQPLTYGFQQGLMYTPYGYAAYNPEQAYSQGVYNPYGSQPYIHMYPYSQLSQAFPGTQNYTALPGFAMPGNQIMQLGGPNANAMTTSVLTIPVPYPTGIPQRPQFVRPTHSSQFMQGSGSDQSNG